MGRSSLRPPDAIHKTCDACRARKVRCIGSGAPHPCEVCRQRSQLCHFSIIQKRQKRGFRAPSVFVAGSEEVERAGSSVLGTLTAPDRDSEKCQLYTRYSPVEKDARMQTLYVDRLLNHSDSTVHVPERNFFPFTGNGIFAGNFSLTFFSESRMATLSAALGNNKVHALVRKIAEVLQGRLQQVPQTDSGSVLRQPQVVRLDPSENQAAKYLRAYFEQAHPFYPFLDHGEFEEMAQENSLNRESNKAWSALYHSIIALGCQYSGLGSFDPGKGEAWQYFSVALGLFPDLLTHEDSLLVLQAITAMAIFSLSISGLQIEHFIISEGARRAQKMACKERLNPTNGYTRAFWVLYTLEKTSSFYYGRSSVFYDFDICHPVPTKLGAMIEGFDWFLASIRHARILSKAYTSLFSVGVIGSTPQYFKHTIEQLRDELEVWRNTIPEQLRPGTRFRAHALALPHATTGMLWLHYQYYGLILALARAKLLLENKFAATDTIFSQQDAKNDIMRPSRSILELTKVMAGIPIAALFILFDLVIHNPKHSETKTNLALLDIAAGHFSRIEYASNGVIPGSLIAEFSYIAREYVDRVQIVSDADNVPRLISSPRGALSNKTPPPASAARLETIGTILVEDKWRRETTDEQLTYTTGTDALQYPLDFSQHDFSVDFSLGTDILDLFHWSGVPMP